MVFYLLPTERNGIQAMQGSIKIKEVFDYAAPQVSKVARRDYNNDQVPQWKGMK